MKIKEGFVLREIAGSWVVVPIGTKVVEFNGMMTLNESGAFLWKILESGSDMDTLISQMLEEYSVEDATARKDIEEFVQLINGKGLLDA